MPTIARLELEWWQLRRESATPSRYGQVIAKVTEELYGTQNGELTEAALLRAEMMRYRDDRRAGRMGDDDWAHVEEGLVRSYRLLKRGVDPTSP